MDARTETVIIPHPNEQNRIAELQRHILRALQAQAADGEVWLPLFPPYVRGLAENAVVSACTITQARRDGDRIVLDAEAATPTGTAHLTLPIAQQLATTPATHDALPLSASDGLPLRLPVFRIARVAFTQTETRTEWTVLESKWVKAKKIK
ncbi:MAG: hypothetical protein K2M90_03520 [Treponemataceae bacterium]|nr:hypothetical protein [Treponemataceae bacterium]MDE7391517.1 hypothetical protein [Treponemataceae bacterium]